MQALQWACMGRQTLLLNWVYYHQVGHAIEAFKVAKGLANANPGVEVHVLLNARTPVELSRACDWIAAAYPIDLDEIVLNGIPRVWDYIVNDHRVTTSPFAFSPPLRAFHDLAATHFEARLWRGGQHELPTNGPPFYQRNAPIRMRVPDSARVWVESLDLAPVNIAVLPAGSSPEPIYPSLSWWRRALSELGREFPGARFFLTGKSAPDDKTSTLVFPADAMKELAALPQVENCVDIGLWNQLALLERCDMLIAPHTGFAFLAPSVGTPWLAVSGARWPECFFNGVPFYCVLPECTEYPCWTTMKPECTGRFEAGRQVECMDDSLTGRVPDLVRGTRLLLRKDFTFDEAWNLYQARIDELGLARERFFEIS